ncbi:hypothetical protein [Isoalcanivorax indicus]|uniref:hypothetical protein n=1 Tax=Isoalcanivorax indicus TaxID=2202653 RepID=UPI000DB9C700|nr:hypothetical protein [Isoalcanivorax indicus]
MLDYHDIFELARHDAVRSAYERFLALRDPAYPDMNYMGLNFREGGISSLKFYFTTYKRVTPEDVEHFLPHAQDFLRYYRLWDPATVRSAEHTGCAFTVKFKGSKVPEVGFHYRLRPTAEAYALIGEPQTLPFAGLDLGARPGINYEYGADGAVSRRRYYYLEKQAHKDYIARRFNKPFAAHSRLCELTEFDGGSKVILWTPDYTPEYLARPVYFDEYAHKVVNRLREELGLVSAMEGFYEQDGAVSTYFFNTLGPKTGNINEGPINFHMDTLKLFIR